MNIDWQHFTPGAALAGGAAIGLACALFILGCGRIAGIAGIVAAPLRSLVAGRGLAAQRSRLLFLVGLLLAPWAWQLVAPLPAVRVDVGWGGLVAAGLLVGAGSRLGNGCTSGHGVCGLSRGSRRSLAHVLVFMAAAIVTVYFLRAGG